MWIFRSIIVGSLLVVAAQKFYILKEDIDNSSLVIQIFFWLQMLFLVLYSIFLILYCSVVFKRRRKKKIGY